MKTSLSEASCAPTDQICLCTDAKYTAALESCVVSSCTIRQSLSKFTTVHLIYYIDTDILATKNVTTMACHAPVRDRTKTVSYAGVAGGIIALIAFILRMIARLRCCGGTFGWDDWTMALTMVRPIAPVSIHSSPWLTTTRHSSSHFRHFRLFVRIAPTNLEFNIF